MGRVSARPPISLPVTLDELGHPPPKMSQVLLGSWSSNPRAPRRRCYQAQPNGFLTILFAFVLAAVLIDLGLVPGLSPPGGILPPRPHGMARVGVLKAGARAWEVVYV